MHSSSLRESRRNACVFGHCYVGAFGGGGRVVGLAAVSSAEEWVLVVGSCWGGGLAVGAGAGAPVCFVVAGSLGGALRGGVGGRLAAVVVAAVVAVGAGVPAPTATPTSITQPRPARFVLGGGGLHAPPKRTKACGVAEEISNTRAFDA